METRFENDTAFIAGNWPLQSDKPSIIFLHGAGCCKALWRNQVNALGDIANTIAIDLPGHCESPGDEKNDIAAYADSVIDFIQCLSPHRPIVCGLSMGGAIAIDLLIREPSVFQAGILMHTGAKLKVHPLIFETLNSGMGGYHEFMTHFAVSQKNDLKRMAEKIRSIAVDSSEVAKSDFEACNRFDRMEEIKFIQVPVQVISGGEDNVTPKKFGQYLASRIPNARYTDIADTGHLSPIERPDRINALIRSFIDRLRRKPHPTPK